MRKLSLVAAIMACGLCIHLSPGTGRADSDRRVLPKPNISPKTIPTAPDQKVAPKGIDPSRIKRPVIRKAEITRLEIDTHANGGWYWQVTVKNTGTDAISGRDLSVQARKVSFPASQNSWLPASGSIVSQTDIAPNQTVMVRRNWSRCCKTNQLKVELRDNTRQSILDTETLTNLMHATANPAPLDVRIKRLEWNDSTKKWKATLKNFSDYTAKVSVQGYLWPQGTSSQTPAGGSMVIVPPNGEATSMWLSAPSAQHGDMLKVHKKFLMSPCGESNNDCGFRGTHNITIPNSRDYLP